MATPRQGYRIASGEKIPSVTTILGRFKESGGLVQWAYKQGREHENLSMRNLPAPIHLYDVVGKAAEAGTIAHDLIEQHLLHGKLFLPGEPLPECAANADVDVIKKARNSFAQFLEWNSQTKLRVIQTEKSLVSEAHKYGGTWDGIGRDVKDRLVLIDWKTSNGVYGDYLYQLAAYAILIEECMPELGPVTGFHLLRVAKEHADFAHHYYGELEAEKRGFILMRELYGIDAVVKKRA
jgi:hypothetical protein